MKILKYTIGVAQGDRAFRMSGDALPAHAEAVDPGTVSFWTPSMASRPDVGRTFRLFATGEEAGYGYEYRLTCRHPETGLVWHLFERTSA